MAAYFVERCCGNVLFPGIRIATRRASALRYFPPFFVEVNQLGKLSEEGGALSCSLSYESAGTCSSTAAAVVWLLTPHALLPNPVSLVDVLVKGKNPSRATWGSDSFYSDFFSYTPRSKNTPFEIAVKKKEKAKKKKNTTTSTTSATHTRWR